MPKLEEVRKRLQEKYLQVHGPVFFDGTEDPSAAEDSATAELQGVFGSVFSEDGGSDPSGTQKDVTAADRDALLERLKNKKAIGRGRAKYTVISTDGLDDAMLNFGIHRGKKVSELARDGEGRGYLDWILKQEFPEHLHRIINEWLSR